MKYWLSNSFVMITSMMRVCCSSPHTLQSLHLYRKILHHFSTAYVLLQKMIGTNGDFKEEQTQQKVTSRHVCTHCAVHIEYVTEHVHAVLEVIYNPLTRPATAIQNSKAAISLCSLRVCYKSVTLLGQARPSPSLSLLHWLILSGSLSPQPHRELQCGK